MEGKNHVQKQPADIASSSTKSVRAISESEVKENKQKQLDELEAIQSIFDESILTIDLENRCGRFIAYPNITESPYYVTFSKGDKRKFPETNDVDASSTLQKMEIKYLPRIEFTFTLDDFYPSLDPPAFLMSCQWLASADMSRLCEQIDMLYSECRSEVLYSCFTFLQDDVLAFLNADKELDVTFLLYSTPTVEANINQTTSYVPDKCRGDSKFDKRIVLNDAMPNILRILRGMNDECTVRLYESNIFRVFIQNSMSTNVRSCSPTIGIAVTFVFRGNKVVIVSGSIAITRTALTVSENISNCKLSKAPLVR